MALVKLNLRPSRTELRQFGFIALGAFGLLAALLYWHWIPIWRIFGTASSAAACGLLALGGLAALFSLIAPQANRPLYVGLSVLAYPIGLVLSYVIMALYFYLILTPIGLIFRLIGRDPLHRSFDREAKSYWVFHKPVLHPKRYFRQY